MGPSFGRVFPFSAEPLTFSSSLAHPHGSFVSAIVHQTVFYGILSGMSVSKNLTAAQIAAIYARFQAPIAAFDCGNKCAPYNENNVPFCCDTGHAVPTAYQSEWDYLRKNTDLWKPWQAQDPEETLRLQAETPPGQVLIACQGHAHCQRGFRSLTCRAFPFFPYIDSRGSFSGLSYYWEYEDRCWVISNLSVVEPVYRAEFISVYDMIFESAPDEKENFAQHSAFMREVFARRRRSIPLLHRDGEVYKIAPRTEKMRRTSIHKLPRFGPYAVAAKLPFPDEV
jgi:hypothetical protein